MLYQGVDFATLFEEYGIFQCDLMKTGWAILFRDGISWGGRKHLNASTEVSVSALSGSSLSVPSCLRCPSAHHIKFLPFSTPWAGLPFLRKLYYFPPALIPAAAHTYSMDLLPVFCLLFVFLSLL